MLLRETTPGMNGAAASVAAATAAKEQPRRPVEALNDTALPAAPVSSRASAASSPAYSDASGDAVPAADDFSDANDAPAPTGGASVANDAPDHVTPPAAATELATATLAPAAAAGTAEPAPPALSFVGWLWSEVTSLFGRKAAVAPAPARPEAFLPPAAAIRGRPYKDVQGQRIDRTSLAASVDAARVGAPVSSSWAQIEDEDNEQQDRVRREDVTARVAAAAREAPRQPTATELMERRSTHIGGFWAALEQEDGEIESSMDDENLSRFQHLQGLQDEQVKRAVDTIANEGDMTNKRHLRSGERAFEAKEIHDPWEKQEKVDRETEEQVRRNKDLQMMQLGSHDAHRLR